MDDFATAVEQEKLVAMKELAYGASHEINNPLANIAARAQALLRDEVNPERRRALAAIHAQALRAHEMISDLMLFARPPRPEPASVNLVEVTQKTVVELADDSKARCVRIVVHAPEYPVVCSGDATQLTVAIKALVTNALEAIGRDGRIDVTCRTAPVENSVTNASQAKQRFPAEGEPCHAGKTATAPFSQWAEIEVDDDGPGIPPEVRRRIFDPFFSGREAGRGLGFGLSKCWRLITAHNGQMLVESPADGGARFTIRLPC